MEEFDLTYDYYSHCRVCGAEVNSDRLEEALRSAHPPTCSYECTCTEARASALARALGEGAWLATETGLVWLDADALTHRIARRLRANEQLELEELEVAA